MVSFDPFSFQEDGPVPRPQLSACSATTSFLRLALELLDLIGPVAAQAIEHDVRPNIASELPVGCRSQAMTLEIHESL